MISPTCTETGIQYGCARCGHPLDALAFDSWALRAWTRDTRELILARFELPFQYCGVLEGVQQFTDRYAADPRRLGTPTIEWRLLVDRNPAAPFLNVRLILNPWGAFTPCVPIRLSTGARVELVVRRVVPDPDDPPAADEPEQIGGRITGRYWYDQSYGAPRGERHG